MISTVDRQQGSDDSNEWRMRTCVDHAIRNEHTQKISSSALQPQNKVIKKLSPIGIHLVFHQLQSRYTEGSKSIVAYLEVGFPAGLEGV